MSATGSSMRSMTRVPLVAVAGAVAPAERRIITPVKSASAGLVQCSETEVSVDESARTFRPVTGPGAVLSLAQPAAAKESNNTTTNRPHDGRPAGTRGFDSIHPVTKVAVRAWPSWAQW